MRTPNIRVEVTTGSGAKQLGWLVSTDRDRSEALVRMDSGEHWRVDPAQVTQTDHCRVCLTDTTDCDECGKCHTVMCGWCWTQHEQDDCDEIRERLIDAECKRRNVRRRVPVAW